MPLNYFDTKHAIKEHDNIILKSGGRFESGGRLGIKDIGVIESTLAHIQNDDYYPEIEDKLTHLFYSINKNHSFTDGNKRSSMVLSAYFLEINCFEHKVSYFFNKMENLSVDVAKDIISKDLLREIITSILYEDDFSEELKLKIYRAKTLVLGV